MSFPLFSYDSISIGLNLSLALFIGIAFGFVLERGGLGNANKLVGQFLLKDLTVFKVMFTAIVTAMIGLFIGHRFGFVNIGLVQISDTYLIPQILGGLLLGVGFAASGYCPGTTIVGMACGKIDAVFSFVGLFLGSFVFALVFDWISSFYFSTRLESDRLDSLFQINTSVIVFLVILLALLGFIFAEKIEGAKKRQKQLLSRC